MAKRLKQYGADTPLDVLVVGAGLSGIDMACRLRLERPGTRFAIVEASERIGGTWALFRYPGVRSDSDMTTLGFPFRPWRSSRSIVAGEDIRRYIEETADAFDLRPLIRFDTRVEAADWSSAVACWTVTLATPAGRETVRARFLYMATGYYDDARGYQPEWPGMERFGGRLVHPQHWPDGLEVAGRRVAVIGSGATAVTLVPALAAQGARVTMVQRSPGYVVAAPAEDRAGAALRRRLPARVADRLVLWKNLLVGNGFHGFTRAFPGTARRLLLRGVANAAGAEAVPHFSPSYDPWDERLCVAPDGDLFAALRSGKAEVVTGRIDRFTEAGLRLEDGREIAADIVVSATGLVVRLLGGAAIGVDGVAVEPAGRLLYRGVLVEGVPNLAIAVGYATASWTLKCDLAARYVCRLLRHMERRGHASVTPRRRGWVETAPLFPLSSGYLARAEDVLPRQGRRGPWRMPDNYLRDALTFRLARLEDGVLCYEGPR